MTKLQFRRYDPWSPLGAGGHASNEEEERPPLPVLVAVERQRSRSFDPAAVDPSVGSEAAAAALKIMVALSRPLSL